MATFLQTKLNWTLEMRSSKKYEKAAGMHYKLFGHSSIAFIDL
jgi:hypothetical protein